MTSVIEVGVVSRRVLDISAAISVVSPAQVAYIDGVRSDCDASADASAQSANESYDHYLQSAAEAQASATSAGESATSAGESLSHAQRSQQWSENPFGEPILAGQYSSLHHAEQSNRFSQASNVSAEASAASAASADNAATRALNSEQQADGYATQANISALATAATESQVNQQIIPVHTDVIRTQALLRDTANGVIRDAVWAEASALDAQAAAADTMADRLHITQQSDHVDDQTQLNAQYTATSQQLATTVSRQSEQVTADRITVEAKASQIDDWQQSVARDRAHIDQQVIIVDQRATHVEEQTLLAETHAADAADSLQETESLLYTITAGLIPMATNLIRTQTLVTAHHAFS